MTVLKAAESGDERALLVALRDLIAARIDDGCSARDLVGSVGASSTWLPSSALVPPAVI